MELAIFDDLLGEVFGMIQFRARQVGEQHAEGDGEQQQRLELLHDRQIQQHAGDEDHHQLQRIIEDLKEAGRL